MGIAATWGRQVVLKRSFSDCADGGGTVRGTLALDLAAASEAVSETEIAMRDGGTHFPLCSATAPDLFTIGCQLPEGHDGLHRNNQVLWQWPQVVTVGGAIPDLDAETDHWQNRQVRLSQGSGL